MIEQIPQPDLYFGLGFFTALSLRRGRVQKIINKIIPLQDEENKQKEDKNKQKEENKQ